MKIKVYSSAYCNPCKALKKQLEQSNLVTNLEFILLDDNTSLAKELNIRTVPMTILFDDSGNEVRRISGSNFLEIEKASKASVETVLS